MVRDRADHKDDDHARRNRHNGFGFRFLNTSRLGLSFRLKLFAVKGNARGSGNRNGSTKYTHIYLLHIIQLGALVGSYFLL